MPVATRNATNSARTSAKSESESVNVKGPPDAVRRMVSVVMPTVNPAFRPWPIVLQHHEAREKTVDLQACFFQLGPRPREPIAPLVRFPVEVAQRHIV